MRDRYLMCDEREGEDERREGRREKTRVYACMRVGREIKDDLRGEIIGEKRGGMERGKETTRS
jgi:hypothetical protein